MRDLVKKILPIATASVVLAACGGGSEDSQAEGGESEDSQAGGEEQLSGQVSIDGSSTVFPIIEAVSEEFIAEQPDIQAPVGVSGTGGGMNRFVAGETDLSNASREMLEEEKQEAEENGVEFIELELAYDGLSVVVNPENDWVDYLTVEELQKIWTDEDVETWADIRDEWPEEEIEFFSPGTDSGTYDYWSEVILEDSNMRRDAQLSEDDNVLVNGVAGSRNGFGYFGYAYYIENTDKLKIVPIEGENGVVEPTEETINSGEYAPLSRPVYTYVNTESLQRPEVLAYVNYLNEVVGELALEVGYINSPAESYESNQEKIDEATNN
ncbi:PstS family phosphate ABC transporter substrate-binding protein [Shouchella shacheensis]|uniref:PstS family phosphate ABC transporter substrate-binding protein n=1 Tax=Shouchella shacheensis TaxID=1649580 RepID=UPI000740447F|nr:PstS family phosphate ABC transporter substrate-binding protein [Shouchella shacheensis]